MKANELRIGNWILIPYQNSPIAIPAHETQVQGITIFGEILTNNTPEHEGLKTHYNHVSGIPLTEEWLLKFGFEVEEGSDADNFWATIHKDSNIRVGMEIRNELYFLCSVDYNIHGLNIHYVHQLQNLYFTLTGNELSLK